MECFLLEHLYAVRRQLFTINDYSYQLDSAVLVSADLLFLSSEQHFSNLRKIIPRILTHCPGPLIDRGQQNYTEQLKQHSCWKNSSFF